MQVSGLTATDLHNFLGATAFQVLLTCDDAGRMPFHYLKYRRRSIYEGGSESEARTDDAIAELVVGVAKAEPKVTQLLLQQSAAHGFSVASLRLIQECSAKVDEASDYDPRTPREIGKDAHDAKTRAIFDDRDDVYRRELALKRRATFLETMVTREPWNLQAEVFQEWLLSRASKSQKKLRALIGRMGDIAGVTVLEKWVEIGGLHQGKPNFGKVSVKQNNTPHIDLTCAHVCFILQITRERIATTLEGFKDVTAAQQLTSLLIMENLSYHHAVLLSCERRSALTDFDWIKKIGEGGFGVAHLCQNRFSGERCVIKFIMPDGGGDGMRRDVKETELHQKLALSEYIAKIFSWGTIDGSWSESVISLSPNTDNLHACPARQVVCCMS